MNIDDLPIQWQENKSSIIKVMGVGGGGGNAVTYMYQQGIHNVNFVICNTDPQALGASCVPVKIQMGDLGAGGDPEEGRKAALESLDKIREVLDTGTRMIFLTAGMGGGTGTGATPVIARLAKELGILTVAIVTIPFDFEGPVTRRKALDGISALKEHVDSLLMINNDKLFEMYGDMTVTDCFSKVDNVLTKAAKGIAEMITLPGKINVDFKDVNNTMVDGGITVMGSATASGENRAREAVEAALNSPLLNNNDITGARRILLNIISGTDENELTGNEVREITGFVTRSAKNASMKWGVGNDVSLGNSVCVTIVATDFCNSGFVDPDLGHLLDDPNSGPIRVYAGPVLDDPNSGPVRVVAGSNVPDEDRYILGAKSYDRKLSVEPGNIYVRETTAVKPIENNWFQSSIKFETDTLTDTAEREPSRAIPYVVDENMNIEYLDNTPAIIRNKIKLENRLSGTEKEVSKYTLSTDKKENTVRLRDNNSYIHDVVD